MKTQTPTSVAKVGQMPEAVIAAIDATDRANAHGAHGEILKLEHLRATPFLILPRRD